MASNSLPNSLPQLFALAEDMADGLQGHGATVGVKQNTEEPFRADLAAAKAAEAAYAAAKGDKETLGTALRVADSNARAYIKATRAVLAQSLGESWSAAWEPAGFPNQSTAVPATQEERLTLCGSLQAYFTANPAKEVAPLGVTAADAGARFAALSDARQAVNSGHAETGRRKNARDAAETSLRLRMRGLVTELGQLLGENDPRWDAFGLNAPGTPSTPDAPEALVLTPGTTGHVLADWADARRASRYRVWVKVEGQDAEFRAAATVTDSDATLNTFPSGRTVHVRVTSANDAGESAPSETKSLMMA